MSFYPSEQSKGLNSLSDVNITNPSDGDGLVHDGNDWTNIPIMTKEQWKKNGAYNLLPNMWTTQTKNGLTYTLRSDGTIAVDNGSPSTTTYVNIVPQSSPIKFPVGKYKMVGFADAGVTGYKNFYVVNITTNTVYQYSSNNGIFEVTDASHKWYCSYAFDTGADPTVFSSAILYPMITTDLNATYADYVPYAKTNRELTEVDTYKTDIVNVANGYSKNNTGKMRFQKRNGVVTCLWSGGSPKVPSAGTEYNIATIPSGYVPKYEVSVPCVDLNTFSSGVLFMFKTNGEVHIIGYSTTTDQSINSYPTVSYVVED